MSKPDITTSRTENASQEARRQRFGAWMREALIWNATFDRAMNSHRPIVFGLRAARPLRCSMTARAAAAHELSAFHVRPTGAVNSLLAWMLWIDTVSFCS
ncbi:hypothetical protein HGRIS_004405 [Hohenbuehelia grisea]|uniref:Uncharacterized protein n=1 Tax=Hohenbuehelia grisea TaxID=104357 RepID=A0ABR3JC53_9AGAR